MASEKRSGDLRMTALLVYVFVIVFITSLANSFTDWNVVISYRDGGFNNPLLPPNDLWLHLFYLFASLGSILGVLLVSHEAIRLAYFIYIVYKRHNKFRPEKSHALTNISESNEIHWGGRYKLFRDESNSISVEQEEESYASSYKLIRQNEDGGGNSGGGATRNDHDDNNDDSPSITRDRDSKGGKESVDPFKRCYKIGCNVPTRLETIGALTLWFQDIPMLTMSLIYAYSQASCDAPDDRDVSQIFLRVGISITAAMVTNLARLAVSILHLTASIGVRVKSNVKCLKKALPNKRDIAFPPDTHVKYCIFVFYFGVLMQFLAVLVMIGTTSGTWYNFFQFQNPNHNDSSLGVYRASNTTSTDKRLFDIAGTVIPNGTFVKFEEIADQGHLPIYCLSEFEYRREDYQIFFAVSQVTVVSNGGNFCVPIVGPQLQNKCTLYYTHLNSVLYYASMNPNTGIDERFSDRCLIVRKGYSAFRSGPQPDFSIDVTENINRTGFPSNGEPLVIYYPTSSDMFYVEVSHIISSIPGVYATQHVFDNNITCSIQFQYDTDSNQITFNYQDVEETSSMQCVCDTVGTNCQQFHQNITYAYLSQDGRPVPYTECSNIPPENLVPYYDPNIPATCPCN